MRARSSALIAVRWRTARPMAKTISTIGNASTISPKPVVASTTSTAAVSIVARPSEIHDRLRSRDAAPR